ncbi:MAG: hypothetical protein MI921_21625 [Cytophagales bacterium]|nr:hypothetical protein [Cytophagales bacterium]
MEFFNGEKLGAALRHWNNTLRDLIEWERVNQDYTQDNYPMEIEESLDADEVGTVIDDQMVIGTIAYSSHHRNLPNGNVSLMVADALKRYNGGSYYSIEIEAPDDNSDADPTAEPDLPTWIIDKTQRRGSQQADYVQEISTTTGW